MQSAYVLTHTASSPINKKKIHVHARRCRVSAVSSASKDLGTLISLADKCNLPEESRLGKQKGDVQ